MPHPVECENYKSTLIYRRQVEKQIMTEVQEGRYVVSVLKPPIVSALGAVPKSDGGIRVIMDCSRPIGGGLNDYAHEDVKVRFQSLKDATSLLTRGAFMAKVDLKSAYRSVSLHPSQYKFTGLKWKFITLTLTLSLYI